MGVSGQRQALAVLYLRERILGIRWVGLRDRLDTQARGKILCLHQGSNPGRTVCSQTLH
jgi:hypothetical protein